MSKRAKTWTALIIMLICLCVLVGYFILNNRAAKEISKISVGVSLLDLYAQNEDLVGWIRIPDTSISYPVMNSDDYLHKSFDKEYLYRGTPFVMSEWTEKSKNSMIYGHNMWVEKTMFNPLHKFKKKKHWEKHKRAEFFVIRDKDSNPYVEKRTYKIHAVDLVNKSGELYGAAAFFDDENEPISGLFDLANKEALYDTKVKWSGGDELTLCTCSYHINGDRHAGRLLVFGTRVKTEKKDLYE